MPHTQANADRLALLLRGGEVCVRIPTVEEDEALAIVREVAARRNQSIYQWTLTDGLVRGPLADQPPVEGTTNPAAALTFLRQELHGDMACLLDLAPHLGEPHVARALRDLLARLPGSGGCAVLIDRPVDVPEFLARQTACFTPVLPNAEQVEQILRSELRRMHLDRGIQVEIVRREWEAVVRNLTGLTARQIRQLAREAVAEDDRFDHSDLPRIIAQKRRMLGSSGTLEQVDVPASLDSIGGMARLKDWLGERTRAFSEQARAFGLVPPRGVLLLGVQGAGKSLCAKAIASAWDRPLVRLDPSNLYDRFVGSSEQRLTEALRQAEAMAPVVLWIDEIEKGFASAAAHSTDGGLSQRMFGTLLTWMNDHTAAVFLVATANNIDALPPELLRKGRFDEIFFVDLPGEEARGRIFEIHLKKRGRDPGSFDLAMLVDASDGFSGAEIEQAVLASLHSAFAAGRQVETTDVLRALRTSPPLSVTRREQVAALRRWAEGRCVPAE
ncbi:MAG: AAA family ATPase [Phycisphaerales bacterium]